MFSKTDFVSKFQFGISNYFQILSVYKLTTFVVVSSQKRCTHWRNMIVVVVGRSCECDCKWAWFRHNYVPLIDSDLINYFADIFKFCKLQISQASHIFSRNRENSVNLRNKSIPRQSWIIFDFIKFLIFPNSNYKYSIQEPDWQDQKFCFQVFWIPTWNSKHIQNNHYSDQKLFENRNYLLPTVVRLINY